ncbi:hypothetical protein VM_15330 [Vibrio mimicus]|nr:hypothetical protein VM_15330 [Vibrio mimicus]
MNGKASSKHTSNAKSCDVGDQLDQFSMIGDKRKQDHSNLKLLNIQHFLPNRHQKNSQAKL